jgi:hypothetical protein
MGRIGMFLVSSILMVGVVLLPAGCAGVGSASVTPPQAPSASTVASQPAGSWQSQALMLGGALQDIEDVVPSIPEPPIGEKPDGTYGALIVGVDRAKRTITIDRCQIPNGEDAVSLAEQADSSQEAARVVNQRKEKIEVPVAQNTSFVVFYPGEGAMDVSPEGHAAMSALSLDQFAEFYRTHRAVLSNSGGWVTITEGRVTSFVEPVSGTS